jgi:hypothetical protein
MIYDSYGPLLSSLPLTFTDRISKEFTREPEAKAGILLRILSFFIGHEYEEDSLNVNTHGFDTVAAPGSEKAVIATDLEVKNIAGSSANGKGRAKLSKSSDTKPDMTHRERDDYGYQHPAASRPQRIVWMAKDCLGLSKVEMAALKDRGIDASTAGAEMNEMGNVLILDAPPDGDSRA